MRYGIESLVYLNVCVYVIEYRMIEGNTLNLQRSTINIVYAKRLDVVQGYFICERLNLKNLRAQAILNK